MHTESIDHTVEKDSSGVDQVGVKVTATFTGVVHTSANDLIGVKVGNRNAAGSSPEFAPGLASLIARLSKDRRRFTLRIAGTTLYDVIPGASDVNPVGQAASGALIDIAHGPIPSVTIVKITSGTSATIRFSISFVITNCGGQGYLHPSGLINFRFAIFEDINCKDGSWLTSRTYTGRIRVAHKNISPHVLARVVTIPPLESGFKRQVVQWHESLDGLHLDFTFQDDEMVASAPWNRFANVGATDWSGTLKMSTNSFGITGIAELDFRLAGPKGTSKVDLMDIAFRVCQAKARMFDFSPGGKSFKQGYMEYFGMGESLESNVINVQCRIMHTGGAEEGTGVGLLTLGKTRVLGQPLGKLGIGYDPQKHFQPGRSAGVGGLFLSLLSTPCLPRSMPFVPEKKVKKGKNDYLPDQPESQGSSTLTGQQSAASASQREGMYLEYNLDSEIFGNTGRIALANGAAKNSKVPSLTVVNLHRETAIREIRIDASRINLNPEIPSPDVYFKDANNIEHTPIGTVKLAAVAPQVSADNRKLLFRTRLQVQYALSRVPSSNDRVPVGCVPYRIVGMSDPSRSIMPAAFVHPNSILR